MATKFFILFLLYCYRFLFFFFFSCIVCPKNLVACSKAVHAAPICLVSAYVTHGCIDSHMDGSMIRSENFANYTTDNHHLAYSSSLPFYFFLFHDRFLNSNWFSWLFIDSAKMTTFLSRNCFPYWMCSDVDRAGAVWIRPVWIGPVWIGPARVALVLIGPARIGPKWFGAMRIGPALFASRRSAKRRIHPGYPIFPNRTQQR